MSNCNATFIPPPAGLYSSIVNFCGSITTLAQIRDIPTANAKKPLVMDVSINDDDERWKLRARVTGENDDGTGYLLPADDSTFIWVKIR